MKSIHYQKAIIILSLFCMFFTACEEDDEVKVAAVTLLEAEYVDNNMQISLKDNETLQLNPFIMPQDASNQQVVYSNKNAEILSISPEGVLIPKAIGIDTITVKAIDGSDIQTSYRVNITDHKVKATGITVSAEASNIELKIGGATFNLADHITISPADTWDKSVTYTSSDENVAMVSAEGIITAKSVGNAVITITTADGSDISRDCNITVLNLVKREIDIERTGWIVTTSVSYSDGNNYVTDGSTGNPEHLFDLDQATYLALVKPGKTFGSYDGSTYSECYFVVDLQTAKNFDYVIWQHRSTLKYSFLRPYSFTISGSNDGSSWTVIKENVQIPNTGDNAPHTTDENVYRIPLVDVPDPITQATAGFEYRYVKVELTSWNTKSGSTMQIAEFGLGKIIVE
uniref:Ig-like domain-containing protein n=1 Tax=uncultured Draconibacterium sp. TaxID=1573823 RepID=UPI003216D425